MFRAVWLYPAALEISFKEKPMKINWKVRIKNVTWWIGLLGVILTAMGISPEMLTDWGIVVENFKNFISNPFLLGSVIVAIIGYNNDPTTSGLSDSQRALSYEKPYKDKV